MELKLTNIQKITLRDILTTAGLKQRQVEDVFLLLSFKPESVQLAFYYRSCGETQEQIADRLGIHQTSVLRMMEEQCDDIKLYMRKDA